MTLTDAVLGGIIILIFLFVGVFMEQITVIAAIGIAIFILYHNPALLILIAVVVGPFLVVGLFSTKLPPPPDNRSDGADEFDRAQQRAVEARYHNRDS